jgi:hypothetical protein
MSDPTSSGYQYYASLMGHGPNCYPIEGAALLWSGYSGSSYDTLFTSTDDFFIGRTFEQTGNKVKFTITTTNVEPDCYTPNGAEFFPGEEGDIEIMLRDQGSDDLYFRVDKWGDGGGPEPLMTFYNNGNSSEPVYLPTHSALSGTAPFEVTFNITHTYMVSGTYIINITMWDDDQWANGDPGTQVVITARVLSPYEIKEKAVEILEGLLPGRLDWIGYETLSLKYSGDDADTILIYNHINRPPFYWETKLLMSTCNVTDGDTIFINGSMLAEGMFGTKLILRIYDEDANLVETTDISTVYTCLEPLKIGQKYGPYEVTGFTKHKGTTYHHYSLFAQRTEDALDHILRSLNRDPRRGYGWWHQYWASWCGYTFYRSLWVDNMHLDPQFGAVVFCEEREAVQDLMEVLKNCLDPVGVQDITWQYNGNVKVDVEAYVLSALWWGGWTWHDGFYDLMPGDSFFLDGSSLANGMLTKRVMLRVYNANTGKLLDTIYVRSSGDWFLEVEPGNIYGAFEILDSTLILEDDSEWDSWFGGEKSWWDWFFGFWYWEHEGFRSSCGWVPSNCTDPTAAAEEERRICSNASLLKQVINMLVMADYILAMVVYMEAENATVGNAENQDDYMYHLKWAQRYRYRAQDNAKKGRPHRAINDYKKSWKHSNLAIKWALRKTDDPVPGPLDDPCDIKCADHDDDDCDQKFKGPWWMYVYVDSCLHKNSAKHGNSHYGWWKNGDCEDDHPWWAPCDD